MTKTEKNKKMLVILEDTKNFYSKNPSKRGLDERGGCVFYNKANGNKCAVGRYLTSTDIQKLESANYIGDAIDNCEGCEKSIWGLIKSKRIKELSRSFWINLQLFHDYSLNWCESGLTESGLKEYENLKSYIQNGNIS